MTSFGKKTARRIVVPVDLATNSRVAFDWALSMAADDSDVYLLHVLDPAHRVWAFIGREYSAERMQERMLSEVSAELDELAAEAPGHCRVHSRVVVGNPAKEILEFVDAEHMDLVVMPNRSADALDRFSLGGVTDRVVRRARCPVVVVPAGVAPPKG